MKAVKISGDQIECLVADAIFYEDNTFQSISGNYTDGFVFGPKEDIEKILDSDWGELIPTSEAQNKEFVVVVGETFISGTGFVAVTNKKTDTIKWLIHLSSFNHPNFVQIERGNFIRLITDYDSPYGTDIVIPIDRPENFNIEHFADIKTRLH